MKTHRLLIATLLALGSTRLARAQGIVLPDPAARGPVPTLPVTPARVRIAAEVSERAARVHLDQTFRNPYDQPLEGTFVLALPAGAAVSDFAFEMNGRRVAGELLDRARAREVYESIVRRYRDPALLEWADRTLVRLSLFPIAPHGEGRVEVIYAQVLPADAGLVELVLPLRTPAAVSAPAADAAIAVELRAERPLGPIYSPTHKIDVSRRETGIAKVSFEDPVARLDRDFLLAFAPADRGVGVNLLTYRPAGEDGYFLLLAAPDERQDRAAVAVAKDVVFVLDTSGSMAADGKLAKAVRALAFGLKGLGGNDRFGLVTFATEARAWRERLVEASPGNVAAAVGRLESTEATGGTAIQDALEAGLRFFAAGPGATRPRYLVFVTDGLPTIGETDPARIARLVPQGELAPRLFAFGVGYDVNAPLLDDLARKGGGKSQYVRPEEDLETKVSSFFRRLNRPVLTDLALAVDGIEVKDLHPGRLPDLFAGDDLVVAGRYRGAGEATVRLTGRLRGESWSESRALRFPASATDKPHLAVIWAERRVGYLLEQIRINGETRELKDEVVRLARAHGLVTPYTSYLVAGEEPQVAMQRERRDLDATPRTLPETALGYVSGGAAWRVPVPAMDAAAGTEASFRASEAIGRLKDEKTAVQPVGVRIVRGKHFTLASGVWTDEAYPAGAAREERVVAFSERYFELVRSRPALGEFFALGERVVVVLDGVAYRIEPR